MALRRACILLLLPGTRFSSHFSAMSSTPSVISSSVMSASEAKWITLKKLVYRDAEGKERLWESAERTTRKSSGIDAVAVLALIRSKTNAFPLSTIIIEQYRPPIDKFIVEMPAGLIDEGETPDQAAIRELEEETGFKANSVVESTPVLVADPGMTNANMKLVVVRVDLPDQMETPEQKLEAGEFIVKRVVEVSKLDQILKEYDSKGYVVDAKLMHWASGYEMARRIAAGEL
ncbi:Nudix hydrolase domain-containing protein [Mycena indigotica]|uniref:Nudix hydrolase domain-containing protein n=1 Tax=Mycena indigotica TaxID=2126181 RepID=A0A8H6S9A7_9AGAR|nr:Nudix hydrolase domain-containing protein [Mycena indigotica]KAF7295198.1 Nudix hydrolase domain-containing protein [Mycena indigotica]